MPRLHPSAAAARLRENAGRAYAMAGERAGAALWRDVAADPDRRGRTRPLAIALAGAVLGAVAACALGGAALAVLAWPNPFAVVVGALFVGIAVTVRPRSRPLRAQPVSRDEAPQLHALVDRVAAAVGARPPDVVAVDADFNASFGRYGFGRRRGLVLGLPLLAALPPQERVALVAHELAHDLNGDPTRSLVVGSAISALHELRRLVAPDAAVPLQRRMAGADGLARLTLGAVTRLLRVPLLALLHLTWRDSQRAEYRADVLAARVAGSDAAVSGLETLHLSTVSRGAVTALAVSDPRGNAVDAIRAAFAAVSGEERGRAWQTAAETRARLDETHPPTVDRVRLIQALPRAAGLVALDEPGSAAIDGELRRFEREVSATLLDRARDRLWRR